MCLLYLYRVGPRLVCLDNLVIQARLKYNGLGYHSSWRQAGRRGPHLRRRFWTVGARQVHPPSGLSLYPIRYPFKHTRGKATEKSTPGAHTAIPIRSPCPASRPRKVSVLRHDHQPRRLVLLYLDHNPGFDRPFRVAHQMGIGRPAVNTPNLSGGGPPCPPSVPASPRSKHLDTIPYRMVYCLDHTS